MKKRNRFLSWLLIFAMMITMFTLPATEVKAELINGVYNTEDPKAFMEALGKKDALFANGHIYFVTKAKLASNPNNTRYKTIGYDVTITNGSYTLEITVDADGGAYFVNKTPMTYAGDMEYTLRAISYDDIVKLCENKYGKNAASVQSIFSTSLIKIRMDAIVTIIKGGVDQGGISAEDGKGGVTAWGTRYYLKNSSDLSALKDYGFSNDFMSYYDITSTVENNPLTLNYYADTKAVSSSYGSVSSGGVINGSFPTSTAATISGTNFSIASNGKINGLSAADTTVKQFQSITLKTTGNLGLKKTGYYLPSGSEWKDANGNVFTAGKTYTASQINWTVTSKATSTDFYANWKPVTYTIKYNANGGTGSIPTETHTYDEGYFTPAANTFTRRGYTFTGWKLVNSSGTAIPITASMLKSGSGSTNLTGLVAPGTSLRNLSTTNGAALTLVAQWEPNEYKITLNPQAPAGKTMTDYTKEFYVLFDNFFSLASGGTSISSLKIPTITGYNFLGYFEGSGEGNENEAYIKKNSSDKTIGQISFPNGTTQYAQDKTLLGQWKPVEVTVTLDANTTATGATATPATQTVTAIYDKNMPEAVLPSKPGFTFKGFYTQKEGKGTQYYNNIMVSSRVSDLLTDTTLYAYWVDSNTPSAYIQMECTTWTNSGDNRTINVDKKGNFTGDDV